MFHRSCSSFLCSLLSSKGSALFGTFKSHSTGSSPGNRIPGSIGNGNNGIIEGRLNVRNAELYVFTFTTFGANSFCLSHLSLIPVSYTHLRAHETRHDLV